MSRLFARLEFIVGGALLAVITGLVFIAAVMRFFGHPLIWSVDLAQLLFIWLCFVGATKAMRERAHLGVDFLVRLLSHRNRLIVETALAIVFIAFMLVLAWEGYLLTILNMERLFGDSGLSYAWVTIAVPAGCIILSLALLENLVEAWRAAGSSGQFVYTRNSGNSSPPAEV